MLARSYLNMEKYSDAAPAYARATALNTKDVDLLIEYAFVLAMTNDRQLAGQPREMINQALQIDPENARALELAGSAEFQAKNYKEAIRYWQKVLEKSPADSELARTVNEQNQRSQIPGRQDRQIMPLALNMTRDNLLFAIIGVLFGFIVGFLFASTMNQRYGPGAPTPAASSQMPADHPPLGAGSGAPASGNMQAEVTAQLEKAQKRADEFRGASQSCRALLPNTAFRSGD